MGAVLAGAVSALVRGPRARRPAPRGYGGREGRYGGRGAGRPLRPSRLPRPRRPTGPGDSSALLTAASDRNRSRKNEGPGAGSPGAGRALRAQPWWRGLAAF